NVHHRIAETGSLRQFSQECVEPGMEQNLPRAQHPPGVVTVEVMAIIAGTVNAHTPDIAGLPDQLVQEFNVLVHAWEPENVDRSSNMTVAWWPKKGLPESKKVQPSPG